MNNHESIGFLCNTGPDPLKNHKATKLDPSSPNQLKKKTLSTLDPLWQNFLDPRMMCVGVCVCYVFGVVLDGLARLTLILLRKGELVPLLKVLSCLCSVSLPRGAVRSVGVVFPGHTRLILPVCPHYCFPYHFESVIRSLVPNHRVKTL